MSRVRLMDELMAAEGGEAFANRAPLLEAAEG
jgi:hypothetical protein